MHAFVSLGAGMVFRFFGHGRKERKDSKWPVASEGSENVPVQERLYNRRDLIGGKFEVLRVFEGGLGRVYVVAEGANRFVLKTTKAAIDSHSRQTFVHEAKTWVLLGRHQNVVPAFWVDEIAGLLCVAAEFVAPDEFGRTSLREYLGRGPRPLAQVLRWAAEFCYGLEHAVSRGLVAHRDIKPENLLVGSRGSLQITDFGIASSRPLRTRDHNFDAQVGASVPASVSGTPPYMAPEQWLGRPQDVRTDVYAFGIVLHELCCGGMPWTASNPKELFEAHLRLSPVVSEHALRDVILTCLAKDPAGRFASPRALLDAIGQVATQHRLALPPRPLPLDQECEELRARSSLAVVGNRQDALRAARELVTKWPDDAGGWTQLCRLYVEEGNLDRAESACRYALQLDASRSAPWNNLGLILARRKRYAKSVEAFQRAIDADPDNTGAMANIAEPLRHLQQHGRAVHYLQQATELAPDKFNVWANLGSLYAALNMNAEAVSALRKALSLTPEHMRSEIQDFLKDVATRPAKAKRGAALLLEERFDEAIPALVAESQSEPDNPVVWQNLALAHLSLGQDEGACSAFERLHQLEPDNQLAWMNLMKLASKRGDLSEADKWCDRYAAIPGFLARSKAFRAYVLEECGQLQDARRLLLCAMEEHPDEPDIFVAYGDLAIKRRVPEHAVEAYRTAVRIMKAQQHEIKRLREIENRLAGAISAARDGA